MDALTTAFYWLDYGGVAVFAATGALAAARKKHDIITFGFFAAITGVGGGTLRDLLIDAPVFWVGRPGYIIVCLITATLVWIVAQSKSKKGWRFKSILWLDAVGLAAFAVVGTAKALSLGVHPFSAMIMGVLTTTFGGIVRDVLAGEPNLLLSREIYVTAALLGAALFAVMSVLGAPFWAGAIMAFVAALTLRSMAILYGLTLPGFPGHKGQGEDHF